jgi:hypothetical protein
MPVNNLKSMFQPAVRPWVKVKHPDRKLQQQLDVVAP